jgi:CheY-like chemotaxis protein
VIPVDDVDQVSISKIRKRVKTISVVTHGPGGNTSYSGLHWPSLEGIFPMTAMKGLSGLLAKEQSILGSDVLGNEHGSIASHDPALDGHQAECTISPRILIAEDNVVNQKVLVRVLKRLGVENVDVVDNGQKAIDACIATSYSLVFMDVQMPVLDGFEATKAIKARCFSHSPKVVFCTAHAVEDYREMAFSVGGDGFVPKPFDLTKIGDCLKDQIGYNFCRS